MDFMTPCVPSYGYASRIVNPSGSTGGKAGTRRMSFVNRGSECTTEMRYDVSGFFS